LGKKFYNSLNWPKFFSSAFKKLNNFQFCEICGYKKRFDNKFLFNPLFCCCFWIRDPEWVTIRIRDAGPGINIPDPQHCILHRFCTRSWILEVNKWRNLKQRVIALFPNGYKLETLGAVAELAEPAVHKKLVQVGLVLDPLLEAGLPIKNPPKKPT
jgi:hypothetical protein